MLKLTDLLERHNGCCTRPKSPLLTEGVNKQLLSENLQYHIDNKLPLVENTFRYGSRAFIDLWNEARLLHESGIIKLDGDDKQIVEETDLGQVIYHNGKVIFLDLIMEAKFKGKEVPLNKPKRGGSKAYYVYVKDPKTKKVKKVSFGSGGLKAKINNPKARKAFAKRHRCSEKKDRTSPGYWSCNLPRYAKQLGFSSSFSGYW